MVYGTRKLFGGTPKPRKKSVNGYELTACAVSITELSSQSVQESKSKGVRPGRQTS